MCSILYANVGGIRDPMKQELTLELCRNQNKDICILSETHINEEQIHQIRNNWLGPIFFSPRDTFSKGMLVLLHPGFDDVTEVDIDPKGRFVSFKIAPLNDRVFCVYALSGHSTREQLTRGRLFEGLQTYMENRTEGNENKILPGDFNCTLDKMDRDEGNKTQKLYRCHSNFALSKIVVDNGLEDLWREENPDTRYDRSLGTRSRIGRVYTDIKIANNTKISHKMVYFTDHYHAIIIDRIPPTTKIGKDLWHFNSSLLNKADLKSYLLL